MSKIEWLDMITILVVLVIAGIFWVIAYRDTIAWWMKCRMATFPLIGTIPRIARQATAATLKNRGESILTRGEHDFLARFLAYVQAIAPARFIELQTFLGRVDDSELAKHRAPTLLTIGLVLMIFEATLTGVAIAPIFAQFDMTPNQRDLYGRIGGLIIAPILLLLTLAAGQQLRRILYARRHQRAMLGAADQYRLPIRSIGIDDDQAQDDPHPSWWQFQARADAPPPLIVPIALLTFVIGFGLIITILRLYQIESSGSLWGDGLALSLFGLTYLAIHVVCLGDGYRHGLNSSKSRGIFQTTLWQTHYLGFEAARARRLGTLNSLFSAYQARQALPQRQTAPSLLQALNQFEDERTRERERLSARDAAERIKPRPTAPKTPPKAPIAARRRRSAKRPPAGKPPKLDVVKDKRIAP